MLSGASANTFAGSFTVTQGTVQLVKSANVVAVPHNLSIQGVNGSTPVVVALDNQQIASNSSVTVSAGTTLNLGSTTQSIGSLNLTSGKLTAAAGGNLSLASGLTSGNATISVPLTFSSTTPAITVNANSTLTINAAISGSAVADLAKLGPGTLTFAGTQANTYAGTTTVSRGTLVVGKSSSLRNPVIAIPGALVIGGAGDTNPAAVQVGASDQFSYGLAVTAYPDGSLDLNQTPIYVGSLNLIGGTVSSGTLGLLGDLTATSGRVSSSSPAHPALISSGMLLGSLTTWDVSNGPASVGLNVTGSIDGGTGIDKTGTGTLLFSGTGVNTYDGTTSVLKGTLELARTGTNDTSVPGALTIGGPLGSSGAVVRLLNSNQINDSSTVTVQPSGLFDLNKQSDYIGQLVINGGLVTTRTGTLSLNDGLIATSPSANDPSRVTGNLNLGPPSTLTSDWVINKGQAAQDLIVTGVIRGSNNQTLSKTGNGTLQFAGTSSNAYPGHTVVHSGVLELNKQNAQAIIGNLLLVGSQPTTVRLLGSNELANHSTVDIHGPGVFALNGNTQEIAGLTMEGGQVTTGSKGALSINQANAIQASFDNAGTATITGNVNLTASPATVSVLSNSPQTNAGLIINGVITGKGVVNKTDQGVLLLSGNATSAVSINSAAGALQVGGVRLNTTVTLNGGILAGSGAVKSVVTSTTAAKQLSVGTSTTFGSLSVTDGVTLSRVDDVPGQARGRSQPRARCGLRSALQRRQSQPQRRDTGGDGPQLHRRGEGRHDLPDHQQYRQRAARRNLRQLAQVGLDPEGGAVRRPGRGLQHPVRHGGQQE